MNLWVIHLKVILIQFIQSVVGKWTLTSCYWLVIAFVKVSLDWSMITCVIRGYLMLRGELQALYELDLWLPLFIWLSLQLWYKRFIGLIQFDILIMTLNWCSFHFCCSFCLYSNQMSSWASTSSFGSPNLKGINIELTQQKIVNGIGPTENWTPPTPSSTTIQVSNFHYFHYNFAYKKLISCQVCLVNQKSFGHWFSRWLSTTKSMMLTMKCEIKK